MNPELALLDATATAELIKRGELSAHEVWAECQARIERANPLLRAVVDVAADMPAALPGPLCGVPFLVKDSTPWPELRWSMGSRLLASNVARQQTPFGKRLVEAGLVCVGKSTTSEMGLLASTETLVAGATHNPWELSCSAAGSSGGSAAAVAAGLVPLAHANDGGGSLRAPASVCGLFGFKPGRGRTVGAALGSSDFGDMTSDHCVTRTVRDSALFLSLVEERTTAEPVGFVRGPSSRRLRVATWTQTLLGAEPEPDVRAAFDDALALLGSLGHHVQEVRAPVYDAATLTDAFFVVAGAAVAGMVESMDRVRDEPVQRDELEPFTWSLVDDVIARGPAALSAARDAFARAAQVYSEAVRAFDVVVTPTLARSSWPIGFLNPMLPRDELIARTGQILGYTPIHNVVGCPAMSVPLSFPPGGVPIGTHVAAAPGHDAVLLQLAYELEAARPWRDRWPPFSIPGRLSPSP